MMRLLGFISLLLLSFSAFAQEPADSLAGDDDDDGQIVLPPMNQQQKLGVKLGFGMTSMIGSEPNNPTPALLLTGGLYYRYRFTTHWSIQPEVLISLRGSNFDNDKGEYSAIRAYFIDAPVLLMYGLNENNSSNLVGGVQYSYMLNSVMYKQGASVAEGTRPALGRHDIMVVAGSHFHTPFIGFQFLVKYGLLNVNKGLIPTLPPLNMGKSMHHITFEVNLTF